MVWTEKVVTEYAVRYWCCKPFRKLVKENKVIFFNKGTGEFTDLDNNILKTCPFCTSDLVNKNF
jgi:hypothetical protein